MRVETGARASAAVPGTTDGGLPVSVPPTRTPRPVTRPVSGETARPAGMRGSRTNPRTTRVTGPVSQDPASVASVTDGDRAASAPVSRADAPERRQAATDAHPPAGSEAPSSQDGGPVTATAGAAVVGVAAASAAGPKEGAAAPEGDATTGPQDEAPSPSPLLEAVDRSTVWLKKTAGVAGAGLSAAYASLTRPRPQEEPMTANPTAPAASARPAPVPPPHPVSGRAPAPGAPRRVRLAISRLDPWSVMKLSLLLSFALGIILVVATAVVWLTLDGLHVFASINDLVKQVVGPESAVNVTDVISFRKVISGATLVAVIDVFLLTAMSTIGAFLYNIVAALVGGVHVTMTDE
ncbi:DUF3566 domain-containing protein [Cellulomonas sp. T2.31MG-18]|uniref:DUF3566 domain-containing protein n=2 Tax=Cellulomonas TaxID=1707 RepID=UPI00366D7461